MDSIRALGTLIGAGLATTYCGYIVVNVVIAIIH